ncbi:hypothetical protein BJY00DRAFT_286292 [Aspergillus carlsbadensis]|nr:hypothetical protein BJY00DRAFT_286292 [Aspergillus carlsbadensis]
MPNMLNKNSDTPLQHQSAPETPRTSSWAALHRRPLTTKWSIALEDSFAGRIVKDDLQFVSQGPPVRTVWLAIWSPKDESIPETLDRIKLYVHPSPEQRFEEAGSDPDEWRYASWYPHVVNGRHQWGLYAYTVRQGSYVQASFISDEPGDLEWALFTWRSLRYAAPPRDNGEPNEGI